MCPDDTGRVQGAAAGLPNPDPFLGLGKHVGEGEQVLWGPVPRVPGFHPGAPTFSQDIQCHGGQNHLPLGRTSSIE